MFRRRGRRRWIHAGLVATGAPARSWPSTSATASWPQELAGDPRVIERSGVNIRDARAGDLGGPAELLVADLSFISLRLVLPVLRDLVEPTGDLVLLVKPQFEVGRERLGKGESSDRRATVPG